jgi:hypothetical protein
VAWVIGHALPMARAAAGADLLKSRPGPSLPRVGQWRPKTPPDKTALQTAIDQFMAACGYYI